MVHRDLKLENILIDSKKEMNIKLSDFGVAEVFEAHNRQIMMRECVGTAYYVAPEVLLGEYDEKCDIWSIGVILYMLLAGKPPFDGENELEIIRKVRAGKYELD